MSNSTNDFEYTGHRKPTHIVSKILAVEDQVDSAIMLFSNDSHHISIHTLASAAKAILLDLSKSNDGNFAFELEVIVKEDRLKEYRKYINAAANFFKHADRDGEEEFNFNESSNDFLIFLCVKGYSELSNRLTPKMGAFLGWFLAMNPELVKDEKLREIFERNKQEVSSISGMTRSESKLVLKKLLNTL